jgi:hypothetical protein
MESVGWFDEAFPACEDYDLWLRISCEHPIPLIDAPLVVKVGGHEDQLSARIPGLDRYRIRSMAQLLESGRLRRDQVAATIEVLSEKCRIYGNGCLKRGKEEEGKYHLDLPDRMRDLYLKGRDTEGEAD